MKNIEQSFKNAIVRWDTGDGEVWIEITVTEKGLELYCDGEGIVELNFIKSAINFALVQPKLLD